MDQPCDTGAPNGGHEQSNPQHVDCIRCGYNLHGLTMGGTCPECGTPVARTLDGNVLRYSSPEYLNKLQRGILFIVISYILSLAMMLLMIPIALLAAFAEFDSNTDYSVIVMAAGLLITFIGLAVGIISVLGWWWFSEPDTDFVGEDSADSTRTALRAIVVALAVIMIINVPVDIAYWSSDTTAAEAASTVMSFIAGLISIVLFFVSLLYVRVIAKRIPHRELMLQAGQYLWLLPLIYIVGACLIVGPIIATVMYLFMLWNVRKQLLILQEQQELDMQPAL